MWFVKTVFRFLSVATAITDNAQLSVSGQRQNAKIEPEKYVFVPDSLVVLLVKKK